MTKKEELFLLLASLTEFYLNKVLFKKLYTSIENFEYLFFNNLNYFKPTVSFSEFERLEEAQKLINKLDCNKIKNTLQKSDINFIAYCDKDYPEGLKSLDDSPFGIFYRGNKNLLKNKKAVAVVGTRSSTNYGISNSKRISSLLANKGITIVSGLAAGIDSSAHSGALEYKSTIAVLGTGVDVIFPSCNKELYKEMIEKENLIISEYPPGTDGAPWNFPQRNRIISALSNAVLIIEGDLQSGALITARFAIKQGKPLFALPGPIDSPQSNGPNVLIKSGVAELLTSVNDILEKIGESKQITLNFENGKTDLSRLNEKEKCIYNFLSSQSKSFDSLLSETNFETQDLTINLSLLELKGLIEKSGDGGFVKII